MSTLVSLLIGAGVIVLIIGLIVTFVRWWRNRS